MKETTTPYQEDSTRDRKQTEFFQIRSVAGKMNTTNITNLVGEKWQKWHIITSEGRLIQLRADAMAPCRLWRQGKSFTLHLEKRVEEGQGRKTIARMIAALAQMQPQWPVRILGERQVSLNLRGRKIFLRRGKCEVAQW